LNYEFQLPVEINSRRDIVGIVVIRKDGIKYPSARDVLVAKELHKSYIIDDRSEEGQGQFPFLIFLVSVPSDQTGWVFSTEFLCFGIRSGDNE
jgi:hypothetical protein